MNYDEAYDFCQRESGYLAEPRSASQTEEINQLLSSDSSYWIGLTDKETEGSSFGIPTEQIVKVIITGEKDNQMTIMAMKTVDISLIG